jgi:hypothetical protein
MVGCHHCRGGLSGERFLFLAELGCGLVVGSCLRARSCGETAGRPSSRPPLSNAESDRTFREPGKAGTRQCCIDSC